MEAKPRKPGPSYFILLLLTRLLEMNLNCQTTNATTFETVYSFSGLDGTVPSALIWAKDGALYGTTVAGGPSYTKSNGGDGTVFRIQTNGSLTTLYSFNGSDGSNPSGPLLQASDGKFYGTTSRGGDNDLGTVFQITTNGTLTTIYSFAGSDGAEPQGALLQGADGNLYGTTGAGGVGFNGSPYSGLGTVFELSTSGTLTTLYSFNGADDGAEPEGGLVQAGDGSLFGTTVIGGSTFFGTIFKLTAGTLTTLHSFSLGYENDGSRPMAGLMQGKDDNLYGTTFGGNGGNGVDLPGTVFRIAPNGTGFATIHNFQGGLDGCNPSAGLVQLADGYLYGTTIGYQNVLTFAWETGGTVFRISPNGGPLTTLHAFTLGSGAAHPASNLVLGPDGTLYGTTTSDSSSPGGTIFRIVLEPSTAPPVLLQTSVSSSGSLTLSFPIVSGQSYTLEQSANLRQPNWMAYTNIIGDGSLFQLTVPTTSNLAQFFRVRQP